MDYKWIDHIVIAVKDLNQGISNYQNGMGMELERTDVSEKLVCSLSTVVLFGLTVRLFPRSLSAILYSVTFFLEKRSTTSCCFRTPPREKFQRFSSV